MTIANSQCTCGDSDFGQYCPIHQPATPPAQPPSEAKVQPSFRTDEEVMDEFVWEDAATILRVFRGGQ
jgi:hypothetical protein